MRARPLDERVHVGLDQSSIHGLALYCEGSPAGRSRPAPTAAARLETYGISYVTVSVRVAEAFAPVVERLTGT